jgi:hypothetical protein
MLAKLRPSTLRIRATLRLAVRHLDDERAAQESREQTGSRLKADSARDTKQKRGT